MRTYWLSFVLWVLVGVLFIGALIPTHYYTTAYKSPEEYARQHYDLHDDFAWAMIDPLFSASFWTAAATIVIAIFTIVLACVTRKQGRLTQQSIDLARDEFMASHRPKLIVRHFQLDDPVRDQVITIRFAIVNIGDTEAIPRYWATEVALWNGANWEPPGIDEVIKPISLPPIANGQRAQVAIHSRFNITSDQIEAVEQNKLIICAVGELTYADGLKTNRRTSFRRNYNLSTKMFDASPNQDQEYQD